MAYATGERPGQGTYYCLSCKQSVKLIDNKDSIPTCPNCDHTKFTK